MGPGAGGGYGACSNQALESLGLTAEQRSRIAAIMDESAAQRLALMDQMHDLRAGAMRSGNPDYAAMASLREKMLTQARERRERIDAVLTPEQRSRLGSGWGGMGGWAGMRGWR